jgi:hypothetical protein
MVEGKGARIESDEAFELIGAAPRSVGESGLAPVIEPIVEALDAEARGYDGRVGEGFGQEVATELYKRRHSTSRGKTASPCRADAALR